MNHCFFLSDGRLYQWKKGENPREIESHFVQEKCKETERQSSIHKWKQQGRGTDPVFGQALLWGNPTAAATISHYRHIELSAGEEDIYYILTNHQVTGLFRYELGENYESRLFHKNDFVSAGMDYSEKAGQFVIAVQEEDGRVHLTLLDAEGKYLETITSGDSRDTEPSFSLQDENHILYQSSGIARNEEGWSIAYGPSFINQFDLKKNEVTEILYDDHYDYLLPREDAEGNLYCIRRPYVSAGPVSPLRIILNVVTFPFRFLVAIMNFLNLFTELFSKNSFKPAGPNLPSQMPKTKHVQVLGQTIHIAKLKKFYQKTDDVSLVPGSWELIRIDRNHDMAVIAKNVSSYDINREGKIVYTNGFKVYEYDGNGAKLKFKHKIIEKIKMA